MAGAENPGGGSAGASVADTTPCNGAQSAVTPLSGWPVLSEESLFTKAVIRPESVSGVAVAESAGDGGKGMSVTLTSTSEPLKHRPLADEPYGCTLCVGACVCVIVCVVGVKEILPLCNIVTEQACARRNE